MISMNNTASYSGIDEFSDEDYYDEDVILNVDREITTIQQQYG